MFGSNRRQFLRGAGGLAAYPKVSLPLGGVQSSSESNLLKGDLIVNAGEQKVIEDREIRLDGNLLVKEGAELILNNVDLKIVHRYKGHRRIKAEPSTEIAVKNSLIKPVETPKSEYHGEDFILTNLMFSCEGSRQVNVRNSDLHVRLGLGKGGPDTQYPNSSISSSKLGYLYWHTGSKTTVESTEIGGLNLDFGKGKSEKLVVKGLRTGKPISDFSLETVDGGKLRLRDTLLHKPPFANFRIGDYLVTKKNVIFKDCDLGYIMTKIPPTSNRLKISSLPSGGHWESFNLANEIEGGELPFDYTIIDSNCSGIKIELMRAKISIENSHVMLHTHGFENNALVRNCDLPGHSNHGCSRILFKNTRINRSIKFLEKVHGGQSIMINGEPLGRGGIFEIEFENSVAILEQIVMAARWGAIRGSVNFSNIRLLDIYWEKGVIERYYPLELQRGSNPLSNQAVELIDSSGNRAWRGKTDEKGLATFKIRFDKDNYDGRWELFIPEFGVSRRVDFLTDTPIGIQVPAETSTASPETATTSSASQPTSQTQGAETPMTESELTTDVGTPGLGFLSGIAGLGGYSLYRLSQNQKD